MNQSVLKMRYIVELIYYFELTYIRGAVSFTLLFVKEKVFNKYHNITATLVARKFYRMQNLFK